MLKPPELPGAQWASYPSLTEHCDTGEESKPPITGKKYARTSPYGLNSPGLRQTQVVMCRACSIDQINFARNHHQTFKMVVAHAGLSRISPARKPVPVDRTARSPRAGGGVMAALELHQRSIQELIKTVKALDSKLAHSEGKTADLKITLGLTLAEAKLVNKSGKDSMPWPEFLEKHFANLKCSRADELIQIGEGRKTDEEVRERVEVGNQKRRRETRGWRGTDAGRCEACNKTNKQRCAGSRRLNGVFR
jgi:hypothetical protein